MMIIHFHIPSGLYGQVKEAVFGKKFQHVVDKGNGSINIGDAAPVKIQSAFNTSLPGLPADFCNTLDSHDLIPFVFRQYTVKVQDFPPVKEIFYRRFLLFVLVKTHFACILTGLAENAGKQNKPTKAFE